MTIQEFCRLTDTYSPLDEVVVLSPGGKELSITGLDHDAIHRTGRICLTTMWSNMLDDDGNIIPKPKPKPKPKRAKNRTKGQVVHTGKRGRPRRVRDENGNKVG